MTHASARTTIPRLRWALLAAALCWMAAFFTMPNPLRAYVPSLFGMTKIAPGIYTDDPRYGPHILDVIHQGNAITASFFGTLKSQPWMIICTTAQCDRTFKTENRAFAYKDRFVLVGHLGLHAHVIAHERVHAEMYTAARAAGASAVPAWLNEGLATYISGDDRPTDFVGTEALWVLEAQDLADWHRLADSRSWQDTYGAAKTLVASLDHSLGRDGLVALITGLHRGQSAQAHVEGTLLRRIN